MVDFAALPLERLERMAADPKNAGMRPVLERRIRELRGEVGAGAGGTITPNPETIGPVDGTTTAKAGTKRRQGHTVGVRNQTEADFEREVLEPRRAEGVTVETLFEALAFTLPGVGTYRPDFLERYPDGVLHAWEIKGGFIHRDGRVKYKAAAHAYPWIRWTMVQRERRGQPWRVLYDRGAAMDRPLPSILTT